MPRWWWIQMIRVGSAPCNCWRIANAVVWRPTTWCSARHGVAGHVRRNAGRCTDHGVVCPWIHITPTTAKAWVENCRCKDGALQAINCCATAAQCEAYKMSAKNSEAENRRFKELVCCRAFWMLEVGDCLMPVTGLGMWDWAGFQPMVGIKLER